LTLIDVTSLKEQLTSEGISYGDKSDEDLQLLLDNMVKELMSYTNAPINPINRKNIIRDFSSDMLELDYYPVKCISSFKIGSKDLTSDDYVLDEDLGILYLNTIMSGLLVIEYVNQVSENVIDNLINPLLFDMFKYRLTNPSSDNGAMSSVKEGDVQVNYDTSTSLGSLIYSRINNLKASYSIRIRML